MIKSKLLSSIGLLKISKPRLKLIKEELINNLIKLIDEEDPEELTEFKSLCDELRKRGIDNISEVISDNILDYTVDMNPTSSNYLIYIEFIFRNTFLLDKIIINNFKL